MFLLRKYKRKQISGNEERENVDCLKPRSTYLCPVIVARVNKKVTVCL